MENKTIGIYGIFRKSDDKCMYIGQSKECENRIYHHLIGNTNIPIKHKDDYYTDIIEKHGFDSNVFRLEREAFWINVFEPEWNICRNRSFSLSEEAKQKIRESRLAKTHSEETKQKMSKNNGAHRPEVRQKISEGMKGIHKGKHWKVVDGKRIWY